MYEKVAVIGLGSLGGFVCDNIANMESVKSLTIVDPDVVKERNLRNSIYTSEDVGQAKTDALEKILKRSKKDLEVIKHKTKFIEGQTNIEKQDLVVDCRDFTYDRGDLIDSRLFISSMYLVVDCRKNINYSEAYKGNYDLNISKQNIIDAANFTASLIQKGLLGDLVKKQCLYTVELDYIDRTAKEYLQKRNTADIIFDETMNQMKITNLMDNVYQIIEMNKKNDVRVYLGNKKTSVISKLINQCTFNSPHDVTSCFSSLVRAPFKNTFYFILVDYMNCSIELISESAAA